MGAPGGERAVQGAVGAEAKQERVWLGPDAGVCRCAVDVSVKESLSLSLDFLQAACLGGVCDVGVVDLACRPCEGTY